MPAMGFVIGIAKRGDRRVAADPGALQLQAR